MAGKKQQAAESNQTTVAGKRPKKANDKATATVTAESNLTTVASTGQLKTGDKSEDDTGSKPDATKPLDIPSEAPPSTLEENKSPAATEVDPANSQEEGEQSDEDEDDDNANDTPAQEAKQDVKEPVLLVHTAPAKDTKTLAAQALKLAKSKAVEKEKKEKEATAEKAKKKKQAKVAAKAAAVATKNNKGKQKHKGGKNRSATKVSPGIRIVENDAGHIRLRSPAANNTRGEEN